jgi:acetyl esterase
MLLDPQIKTMLDQAAGANLPPLTGGTPAQARAQFETLIKTMRDGLPIEPVANVADRSIPGAAGSIPIRVYTPSGTPPFPLLVFFHGGGWVLGDLESHDGLCRMLTNQAGSITVSVDYRLAPEAKFPAAAEDCYAATKWAAANASAIGADASRVAIAGDSAGGNLAAVVALIARDRGGPGLAFQLLVYPAIDPASDAPSQKENAKGYLLTNADMIWFWGHYLGGPQDAANPYANPLKAKWLGGLPPAMVITAGFDPLRDEGEDYAAALKKAGVPTLLKRYDSAIHGFFGPAYEIGKAAVAEACTALREAYKK